MNRRSALKLSGLSLAAALCRSGESEAEREPGTPQKLGRFSVQVPLNLLGDATSDTLKDILRDLYAKRYEARGLPRKYQDLSFIFAPYVSLNLAHEVISLHHGWDYVFREDSRDPITDVQVTLFRPLSMDIDVILSEIEACIYQTQALARKYLSDVRDLDSDATGTVLAFFDLSSRQDLEDGDLGEILKKYAAQQYESQGVASERFYYPPQESDDGMRYQHVVYSPSEDRPLETTTLIVEASRSGKRSTTLYMRFNRQTNEIWSDTLTVPQDVLKRYQLMERLYHSHEG